EELRVLRINHMISAGQEDELRQLKALENQYKKYAQERKAWMSEGISGGLKSGALDRDKESATRTAQWTIDAMKGAEQFLGETAGNYFVDTIMHKRKTDLGKVFVELGDSLVKKLMTMGTTKLFDSIWSGVGKTLGLEGKGKPDGSSASKALHVTFDGAKGIGGLGGGGTPQRVAGASKIAYAMGGGKGGGALGGISSMGGYQKIMKDMMKLDKLDDKLFKEDLKENKIVGKDNQKMYKQLFGQEDTYQQMINDRIDLNQESFKTDNLNQYQDTFSTMTNSITSIWSLGQGIMTAAGLQGEASRYGTMLSYGMQALSLMWTLITKGVLMKAFMAGASAFSSVWETVGFPAAVVLAPIMAAVAFAGTIAGGLMGGGGGGGGGGGPDVSTPGSMGKLGQSFHQGGHLQPYYAHAGFPPLKSGEVPFIGLDTERVLSPKQTYDYEAGMRAAGGRPGENGGGQVNNLSISIDARGADKNIDWKKVVRKQIAPELKRLMGNTVNG
ncbi:MAG: hypothetical protein Q7O12_15525, partial [Deltaproteobacteria bacterium]|nr:hypothetical protein [Deltaproteobacteria bacterium]